MPASASLLLLLCGCRWSASSTVNPRSRWPPYLTSQALQLASFRQIWPSAPATAHLFVQHGSPTVARLPCCAGMGCPAGRSQRYCCRASPRPQAAAQPHSPSLGTSAGPGVSKNGTGDIHMGTSIALLLWF